MRADVLIRLREDLIGVRHPFVWCYLLVDHDEVVAVDTGMGRSGRFVRRWFEETERPPEHLKAILLTHGHVDHVACAEKLRRWSGATIHLHPSDLRLVHGKSRWWNPVPTIAEFAMRPLFGWRRPVVEGSLEDEQELPFWGGLRVVHLPGHTPGHVAFYAPAKRVLFVGDAIIHPLTGPGFPLPFLNVDDRQNRASVLRLLDLEVDWIYPMHHAGLSNNLMENLRRYADRRREAEAAGRDPDPPGRVHRKLP